jgi:hypothetical protein
MAIRRDTSGLADAHYRGTDFAATTPAIRCTG